MKNVILIPDVHGRTFWKEAIPHVEDGTPCIFLGDYVDPYSSEDISELDALKNLRELLAFAYDHRDRVTLLLGNHDLSYFGEPEGIWSVSADRYSLECGDLYAEYYNENRSLFSLCSFREIGGKPFLFSHAGVHPLWLSWCGLFDDVNDPCDGKAVAEKIEELFQKSLYSRKRTEFMDSLSMVGSFRGGNDFCSSPVWADVREFADYHGKFAQVFGHTQQREGKPRWEGNNVCIDCRQCFYLDHEGVLRYLENDELAK